MPAAADRKAAFLATLSTRRACRAGRARASGMPGKPPPLPRSSRASSARPRSTGTAARLSRTCSRIAASGVADRGQVDRLVPGQEQPDVVDQAGPNIRGEPGQAQHGQPGRQAGLDPGQLAGRHRRQVPDTRRERFAFLVHASSGLGEVNRPLALPASTYWRTQRRSVFRVASGCGPGLPEPLACHVTLRPVRVRMLDARGAAGPRQRGYPRSAHSIGPNGGQTTI